jgi:hypothetical protein
MRAHLRANTTVECVQCECTCVSCKQTSIVFVPMHQFNAWRNGALAQDAFPYLHADQRELLISGTCPDCFEKLFGELEQEGDAMCATNCTKCNQRVIILTEEKP